MCEPFNVCPTYNLYIFTKGAFLYEQKIKGRKNGEEMKKKGKKNERI